LKNLLSKNIAVKPPCLFDSSIVVTIKVQYAVNGQYSEKRSRDLNLDISQIEKSNAPRSELNHMYKYRFLAMNSEGKVVPIYDKYQTILGGGGDLVLTFKGLAGSSFENCEPTIQSLTKGSQY